MIATVGTFDGVHLGHRFLLNRLREMAAAKGEQGAVFVLVDHPLSVVAPERMPAQLMTAGEKTALIAELYPEMRVVALRFTDRLRRLSHREFMAWLADEYGVSALLVGYDNRFGSDREVGPEQYPATGRELGMEVEICAPLPEVSSSRIRRLLAAGQIEEGNRLLGRPYSLQGEVVHGRQLGRTLGFPTANLRPTDAAKLIPARGVYAAWAAILPDETGEKCVQLPTVVNLGLCPTVECPETQRSIEAHIISDSPGNLYGRRILLSFLSRLRDEEKFASLDALKSQIAADCQSALKILEGGADKTAPLGC